MVISQDKVKERGAIATPDSSRMDVGEQGTRRRVEETSSVQGMMSFECAFEPTKRC